MSDLEIKVKDAAKLLSSDERELKRTFQLLKSDDVVAFFWSDTNKWIRAIIKSIDLQRKFAHIWATDYGLPFVATPKELRRFSSHQVQLLEQRLPNERFHLGGIAHAIPTVSCDTNTKELKETTIWSAEAIETALGKINQATALRFDFQRAIEVNHVKRQFGHLMLKTANGTWLHLKRHLIDLKMAKDTKVAFDKSKLSSAALDDAPLHTKIVSVKINIQSFPVNQNETDDSIRSQSSNPKPRDRKVQHDRNVAEKSSTSKSTSKFSGKNKEGNGSAAQTERDFVRFRLEQLKNKILQKADGNSSSSRNKSSDVQSKAFSDSLAVPGNIRQANDHLIDVTH